MSSILKRTIIEQVFKEDEIQSISKVGGKPVKWIFDFKSQALRKEFLEEYTRAFWEAFAAEFPDGVQVGGMETGAIPLVTGISVFAPADRRVNAFYIRKSRKKGDLANALEGELSNEPIVLVDDILNAGRTIGKQIKIIEDLGKKVSAVFVCVRYRDQSFYRDLLDRGIRIVSVFELDDFRDSLPVQNIADNAPSAKDLDRYEVEYRIRLTNKPNLYAVVPKSGPVLSGGYIYMGADDGGFHCIRAEDGEQVWTYRVLFGSAGKYIFSTPAVYRDRVIFGAYDGNLYCLNRFTGQREWVFSDADWIGSSPCVNEKDGVVYIGLEFGLPGRRGGIVAIDILTGKTRWKNYTLPGLVHASPAYNEKSGLVACGCNDNVFYAFHADTGKIAWQFKTLDEIKYGAVFDGEGGRVIFGGMDGGAYVLRTKDGTLEHRFDARYGFYSTPVERGGKIVVGSLDKRVYCFDIDARKTAWEFETAGRIFSSPAADEESVFVGSNDGRLYQFEMATGKILATTQLTERIVNRIQIGRRPDGKRCLYVATHAGELYKLRER